MYPMHGLRKSVLRIRSERSWKWIASAPEWAAVSVVLWWKFRLGTYWLSKKKKLPWIAQLCDCVLFLRPSDRYSVYVVFVHCNSCQIPPGCLHVLAKSRELCLVFCLCVPGVICFCLLRLFTQLVCLLFSNFAVGKCAFWQKRHEKFADSRSALVFWSVLWRLSVWAHPRFLSHSYMKRIFREISMQGTNCKHDFLGPFRTFKILLLKLKAAFVATHTRHLHWMLCAREAGKHVRSWILSQFRGVLHRTTPRCITPFHDTGQVTARNISKSSKRVHEQVLSSLCAVLEREQDKGFSQPSASEGKGARCRE